MFCVGCGPDMSAEVITEDVGGQPASQDQMQEYMEAQRQQGQGYGSQQPSGPPQ